MVRRSSTKSSQSPTRQPAMMHSIWRNLGHQAAYPEGAVSGARARDDDVAVAVAAVHFPAVPTPSRARAHVHAHVLRHLAFHFSSVRWSP